MFILNHLRFEEGTDPSIYLEGLRSCRWEYLLVELEGSPAQENPFHHWAGKLSPGINDNIKAQLIHWNSIMYQVRVKFLHVFLSVLVPLNHHRKSVGLLWPFLAQFGILTTPCTLHQSPGCSPVRQKYIIMSYKYFNCSKKTKVCKILQLHFWSSVW